MKKKRQRLNILVTSGATREPIDAVRFISNYATGLFGCEVAREAKHRGHRVILIAGQLTSAKPNGVPSIEIKTARQLQSALKAKFNWCDCLIMAAAVGDFRAKKAGQRKLNRNKRKELTLVLRPNPDILAGLGRRKGQKILVGVALETENLSKNAQTKLRQKNLDLIVATQMKPGSYPFGPVKLEALIIDRKGRKQRVRRTSKRRLSRILLDSIEKLMLS